MSASTVIATDLSRSDFPKDFVFGAATAAFQIEGAAAQYGRAASLWDVFTVQNPKNVSDGTNANVAIDHYHLFKEDIKLMKKIGLDAYRFSISWPRVLPGGRLSAGVNKLGVQFYNDLINELLANGIEPYVTLFHWDTPQALEDEYGGFLCEKIVDDFCEFADVCFWEFGDRVKNWITLNEPWTYSVLGYAGGGTAPGRGVVNSTEHIKDSVPKHRCHRPHDEDACETGNPGTEPYTVTHNLILAHGAAVKLYRDNYKCQEGRIGITLVSQWWEPMTNTPEDKEAVERMADFMFGWYMAPITYGDYPERMKEIVKDRLPKFTEDQSKNLKMSYDFVGVNYYTARFASDISKEPISVVSYNTDYMVKVSEKSADGKLIGVQAGSDWLYDYPPGMYKLLKHVKNRYNDPIIYITENGFDETNDPKTTISVARQDYKRITYMHGHLKAVKQAMDEKVRVRGYFVWSLIDNYEWQSGYSVRFGLIYVDYKNHLARYPKFSALWYMNFLHKADGASQQQQISGNKRPALDNVDDIGTDSTGQKAPKRQVIYKV